MAKNDGGPAFPRPLASLGAPERFNERSSDEQDGMSIRDWFAGQALVGYSPIHAGENHEELALLAYRIADAMLAERSKEQP